MTTSSLAPPHGGVLVGLGADAARAAELTRSCDVSWDLTPRQLCDFELLANGGFSPLRGFLRRRDYEEICASKRLADGTLWPIPIALDVPATLASVLRPGQLLGLRDPEGVLLGAVHVEDVWQPDLRVEAEAVYGTTRLDHPGVAHLLTATHPFYVGGTVEALQPPVHYDFLALRLTPAELRADFARFGWRRIVAFQTRNPIHRAHQELTLRAARDIEAHLLIHPVVGMTKPGDVDHYTRVRCYEAILPSYPAGMAKLALLPLAMRMAGPREALWHAIIRKNYGCTHLVVGRDHAGPGAGADGKPFYDPYAAQELVAKHEDELGLRMVPFRNVVYVEDRGEYLPEDEVPRNSRVLSLSGTELRRRLARGEEIPAWFTFPAVAAELQRRHPRRERQGVTVFFTGLSGAGKSAIANALRVKLLELGTRQVTLLDGDLVRRHLSSELGFSKEHRDLNIRRIGFVAAEVTKHGGIALCAPIAPYDAARREARALIEGNGGFVLVHVSTPLAVCEQRDRKGLYAKARAGAVTAFTGISDPYEPPEDAEIVIDTTGRTPSECADVIVDYLSGEGYV